MQRLHKLLLSIIAIVHIVPVLLGILLFIALVVIGNGFGWWEIPSSSPGDY